MPYYPENGDKAYFENQTSDEKIAADYANMPLIQIYELDIFTFWGLLHDAVVWNCRRSEHGREYLENAWNYMQTKPDKDKLKAKFGKGVNKNGR